jgi:hypothetical protein
MGLLLIISVSLTGIVRYNASKIESIGVTGVFLPIASAMESENIIKHVGDLVYFKAKIKNTGEIDASYIVIVKWKVHGTEEWETGGIEDIWITTGSHEEITIGFVECNEWMVDKYFDVKFTLYEAETERELDIKEIPEAWYVEEYEVLGTFYSYWIQ